MVDPAIDIAIGILIIIGFLFLAGRITNEIFKPNDKDNNTKG